jgi:hypothetical protein
MRFRKPARLRSWKWPFDQFRNALDNENEEGNWQVLNASFNGIKLGVISAIR